MRIIIAITFLFVASVCAAQRFSKPAAATHEQVLASVAANTNVSKRLKVIRAESDTSIYLIFSAPLTAAEIIAVSNTVYSIDPVQYKTEGDYDLEIKITNDLQSVYALTGIDYRPSQTNAFKPGDSLRIFRDIYEFETTNTTMTAADERKLNRAKQNLDFCLAQYLNNRTIDATEWWMLSTNFGTTNAP